MGVHGSFPLFHLTHWVLLEYLCSSLSRKVSLPRPAFAVLGDDVIIASPELAALYSERMKLMGVEVNDDKSFSSLSLGSFAGFIGITTQKGGDVFKPFKFGPDFSLRGRTVQVLSSVGPEVRKWSNWWSRAYEIYRGSLPFRDIDLSPIFKTDIIEGGRSVLSSRYFASTRMRALYEVEFPPEADILLRIDNVWTQERLVLFHEQDVFQGVTFNPEEYATSERQRRKSFSPTFVLQNIDVPRSPVGYRELPGYPTVKGKGGYSRDI